MSRCRLAVPAATLASLVLAGCTLPRGTSVPAHSEEPAAGTLTLTASFLRPHDALVYREGVMVEVLLLDADGDRVAVHRGHPGRPMVFDDLAAGRYVVRPAVRPCDANCGYLDPRLDGCSRTIHVTHHVDVQVALLVGSPCHLRTSKPGRPGSAR